MDCDEQATFSKDMGEIRKHSDAVVSKWKHIHCPTYQVHCLSCKDFEDKFLYRFYNSNLCPVESIPLYIPTDWLSDYLS